MEGDIRLHEHVSRDLKGAMAIMGFPSVGLVGSIAANFIVRTLDLELVASVISSRFPPYAIVQNGIPRPPVRIYSGTRRCGGGEACEHLVVITTEFMPRMDVIKPLADVIVDYCGRHGIGTMVSLEGINMGPQAEGSPIYGVGSTDRAMGMVSRYGIEPMTEGMVNGISGVLLYEGQRRGCDVVCLLGPARMNYPDARGAARLLEAVGEMLPELKLDPEPLYKEAESIEEQMRAAMRSMAQTSKAEDSIIYG